MQAEIFVQDEDIEQHIIQKQKEKQASKKSGGMGMGGGGAADNANDANKGEQIKKKKNVKKTSKPNK